MQQWIAHQRRKLVEFLDDVQHAVYHLVFGRQSLDDLPCVLTLTRNDLKVLVRKDTLPCGHSAYWIDMEVKAESGDRWLNAAVLRDVDLPTEIGLLQEVLEELDALERLERLEQGPRTIA
jgi:hypothetical protein